MRFLSLLPLPLAAILTAATIHVPGDQPTIQAGIDAASTGDVVEIACGSYAENDIVLKGGITVRSTTGLATCVTITPGSPREGFIGADLDGPVLLQGMTMSGPYRGAMLTDCAMGVVLEDMAFVEQTNGVRLEDCADVTVRRCEFRLNGSPEEGGGIYARFSELSIENSEFEGNTTYTAHPPSNFGGGGALFSEGGGLSVTGTLFDSNRATALPGYGFGTNHGGSLLVLDSDSPTTLDDCRFVDGHAYRGGALYANASDVIVTDCEFERNGANLGGGACMVEDGSFMLQTSSLLDNHSGTGGGGALALFSTTGALVQSVFAGNRADRGAAMSAGGPGGSTDLIRCTLVDNPADAAARAGAVFHLGGGQVLTVTQTIIAFQSDGVAIACNASAPTVVNCSDLFGNVEGDFGEFCIPVLTDVIYEDPLFCNADLLDFGLQHGSPCLLGQSPCQGVIGAFGIGCLDPVSASEGVVASSWGRIKSLYR